MLTGKFSHKNGFTDNTTCKFDGTQQTMPKLLQQAGYQTAIVGKWHLETLPTGFDFWEISLLFCNQSRLSSVMILVTYPLLFTVSFVCVIKSPNFFYTAASFAVLGGLVSCQSRQKPLNIVYIMTDDHTS